MQINTSNTIELPQIKRAIFFFLSDSIKLMLIKLIIAVMLIADMIILINNIIYAACFIRLIMLTAIASHQHWTT